VIKQNISRLIWASVAVALLLCIAAAASAQRKGTTPKAASGPKVTVLNIAGLKKVIKPRGKPLLINFWATWCDPCREEFPDLVKLDEQYKGKIDFITISLDYLAELKGDVPKFLSEMNATMPAYLLHVPDENVAISLLATDWSGSLPMTFLFKPDGSKAYSKMGKVKIPALETEIKKLIENTPAAN
jgi:thiol-disulfide isomerase/thioredoxin